MENSVLSSSNTDVIEIKSSNPRNERDNSKGQDREIVESSPSGRSANMGMASSSSSRDIYEPSSESSHTHGQRAAQSTEDEGSEGYRNSENSSNLGAHSRHKRKARNEQPSGDHSQVTAEIIDLTNDEVPDVRNLERAVSDSHSYKRRTSVEASTSGSLVDTDNRKPSSSTRSTAYGRSRRSQPSGSEDITILSESSSRPLLGARNGSVILPRWQPDAEVTYCPICRTQFSFFVRKHHCRKCGRVVCSSCSPHRITIPYQFIVQPDLNIITPAQRNRGSLYVSQNVDGIAGLGGGEKVRMCNTCVDSPVSPGGESDRRPGGVSGRHSHHRESRAANDRDARVRFQTTGEVSAGPGAPRDDTMTARDFIMRSRSSTVSTEIPGSSHGRPVYAGHTPSRSLASNAMNTLGYQNTRSRAFADYGSYQGRVSVSDSSGLISGSNPQPHYRSMLDPNHAANPNATPDLSRPLPPAPRIPEEDECPVCHRELPSRTLTDFERLREEHINDCILRQISVHSGSVRPGAYTSNSQPPPQSSSPTPIPPSLAQEPVLNTPEARSAARERAHAAVINAALASPSSSAQRLTGMFPYKATEKDCVDDAECTICLEEFEVGVGMARLECLCRFHAKCIRDWFRGHPGECPVHRMMGME